jgi:hypothetical protein
MYTTISGGDTMTPMGLYYNPTSFATGLPSIDGLSFTLTNGTAIPATITIPLFVLPAPAVNTGNNPTVDSGSTTASLAYTVTSVVTPTTYTITWSDGAPAAGFVPVTNAPLTGSPITINIPATAPPHSYTGTLQVSDGTCSSIGYGFYVIVAGSPVVITDSATNITPTVARLNAMIYANGSSSADSFYYSTNSSLTGATVVVGSPDTVLAGADTVSVIAPLTDLMANTKYYFRATATNLLGTSFGAIDSFTTGDNAPIFNPNIQELNICHDIMAYDISGFLAVTDADSGQTETLTVLDSSLHGTITGFPTTVVSGNSVAPSGTITYQPAPGYVGADSFTIQVSDGVDTATKKFYVNTQATPSIALTNDTVSVTRGATVANFAYTSPVANPNTYSITWSSAAMAAGFADSLGDTLPPSPIAVAISSLTPVGIYTGTLTVSNSGQCTSSETPITVTIDSLPVIVTLAATNITATSVTLNGSVSDENAATAIYFQYNQDSVLVYTRAKHPATPDSVTSPTTTPVNYNIYTLTANTKYYYRAYGTNAAGSDSGQILSFTTSFAPVFTDTSTQHKLICENSSLNIDTLLAVTDSTSGDTITYSAVYTSSTGLVLPAPFVTTGSGTHIPTGGSFTPPAGTSGTDSFVVKIRDNHNDSSFVTIVVSVTPTPSITLSSPALVPHGATSKNVAYTATGSPADYSITWISPGFTNVSNATLNPDSVTLAIPGGKDTGSYTGSITVSNAMGCVSAADTFHVYIGNRVAIFADPATEVTATFFRLHAHGNDSGTNVVAYFIVSTSPSLASGTYVNGATITTPGAFVDSGAAGGLSSGTTYYYRAFGRDSVGTFESSLDSVTTVSLTALTVPSSQTLTVCENSGAVNIDTFLRAQGITAGQEIVWTEYAASTHGGIVSGLPDSNVAVTTVDTPSGVTYTPGTNFSGLDSFVVSIKNNFGDSTHTTLYVTVRPTPVITVNTITPVCNNTATEVIHFSTTDTGVTYAYSTTDTNLHLLSGTADSIASFVPSNHTTSTLIDTITVTYSSAGCADSSPAYIPVTIYPTPVVYATTDRNACDSTTFGTITFSGPDTYPTTYNWTNIGQTIGMANTSGTDSIPSFTAVGSATSSRSAQIVVTPTANGCTGTSDSFYIHVNPVPGVTNPGNQAFCAGTNDTVRFDSSVAVPGTSYTWTNNNTSIGLANSGTGNIAFTSTDSSSSPIIATIVVTPYTGTTSGCTGTSQTFTITINPTPILTNRIVPNPICNNTSFGFTPTTNVAFDSIVWSRPTTPGISNAPIVHSTDPTGYTLDTLHNDTTIAVTVPYSYTIYAYGCSTTTIDSETVEPTLALTNMVYDSVICSGTAFLDTLTSATPGVNFYWSRAMVSGVSDTANSGTTPYINETLYNTSNSPVVVVYTDSINVPGTVCSSVYTNSVTVNPVPAFTNTSFATSSICSGGSFTFTPTSNVAGTTFHWDRPFVPGIAELGADSAGSINEQLINVTNFNIGVTYYYTDSAFGCGNDTTKELMVIVHPKPNLLTATFDTTVCSGEPFTYIPGGVGDSGVTVSYSAPSVSGITNTDSAGHGTLTSTLTNTTGTLTTVTYEVVTSIDSSSCADSQRLTVNVLPQVAVPNISTAAGSAFCTGANYIDFETDSVNHNGDSLMWSATNASVFAVGSTSQYALIDFDTAGTAVVTVAYHVTPYGCTGSASYTVTVGPGAITDTPQVVYNYGVIECLDNTVDSYQWGYDDIDTLNSTTLPGQTLQFLVMPTLDVNKLYWVIISKGGCTQKIYLTDPARGTHRGTNNGGGTIQPAAQVTDVQIFPNPATEDVNVKITTSITGDIDVEVLNLLGQKLYSAMAVDNKAKINVAGLPAGTYLINCYREGIQISAARFIKN